MKKKVNILRLMLVSSNISIKLRRANFPLFGLTGTTMIGATYFSRYFFLAFNKGLLYEVASENFHTSFIYKVWHKSSGLTFDYNLSADFYE